MIVRIEQIAYMDKKAVVPWSPSSRGSFISVVVVVVGGSGAS